MTMIRLPGLFFVGIVLIGAVLVVLDWASDNPWEPLAVWWIPVGGIVLGLWLAMGAFAGFSMTYMVWHL